MLEPTLCSQISCERSEPLCGTASRVRSWLLIEQPGGWGRDAVVQSGLGEELGRKLKQATAPHGVRVVLIRRPGGSASDERQMYLCFSGLDDRWVLRLEGLRPEDLLEADLSPIAEGTRPTVGVEHDDPLYLVCAHGEHDTCCGLLGPKVAKELMSERPQQTWESSHVGGDRFAANLVCLPYGLYFGRVDDPLRTASMYERGLIDLPHYRGRSCHVPVVQAAEVMLRNRDGIEGIDDLAPKERTDHGGGESTLSFKTASGASRSIRIRVERAEKRRLTCEATNPGRPRAFVEVST